MPSRAPRKAGRRAAPRAAALAWAAGLLLCLRHMLLRVPAPDDVLPPNYPRSVALAAAAARHAHDPAYAAELAAFERFAAPRSCALGGPQHDMIFENLRPYEAAGISEAAIMAGFAQCHDPLLIRITGHAVNATLAGGRPGRAGRHHWYIDLFRRLAPHLGDTLLVLNMQDEPCSWTAPLPAPAQAAYSAGALGLEAAWLAHGCDGAGLRRLRQLHGFFVSPLTFPATREPTPVWSLYSLPACFGDILMPNEGGLHRGPGERVCPPPGTARLADKNQTAIFRGSSSGGYAGPNHTQEHFRRFHRQRLVEHCAGLGRADVDARITKWAHCGGRNCVAQSMRYGRAAELPESEILGHAYHLLVDGHGGLDRVARHLCAGSVALLGVVFQEWFYRGLKPYEHYLPLDIDYHNLEELLDWAKAHPVEAQAIADNAARYVNDRVRLADAECYTLRLAAEFNRLRRWHAALEAQQESGRHEGVQPP